MSKLTKKYNLNSRNMTIKEKYSNLLADVSAVIETKVKSNGGVLSLYEHSGADVDDLLRVDGGVGAFFIYKLVFGGEGIIRAKCVGIDRTGTEGQKFDVYVYQLPIAERINLAIYIESL